MTCIHRGTSGAALLLGFVAFAAAAGATPCGFELVGQQPYGPARVIATDGAYIYFDSGQLRLMIADISDPGSPRVVGQLELPIPISAIAASEGLVYGLYSFYGLRVIDVSDPKSPIEVGALDTPGSALDIAVSGRYAYIADGRAGLRIVDVKEPSRPIEVGAVDTPGLAVAVAVEGDYAYVSDGDGGLRVVDVRTPSAPREVGALDDLDHASAVVVVSGYVWVEVRGGIRAVDVSTPTAPGVVGSLELAWTGVRRFAVHGGYVYGSTGLVGLVVLDATDPTSPAQVAVTPPVASLELAVAAGHAYAATGVGVRVLDLGDPTSPTEIGSVNARGTAVAVAVTDDLAYVAYSSYMAYSSGVEVVDVSDPTHPEPLAFVRTPPSWAVDLALGDDVLHVGRGDGGLMVFDVSTPTAPVEVASIATSAFDVALDAGYAYLGGRNGVSVVDLTNPWSPAEVGYVSGVSRAEVAASGRHVFAASTSYRDLTVIDVSVPTAPLEVAWYQPEGDFDALGGLVVHGGHAFVTSISFPSFRLTFHVLDVSTPSDPLEVAAAELGGGDPYDLVLAGEHAYVVSSSAVRVVDVSDPRSPVVVGDHYVPQARAVALSGGLAYVAHGINGLRIFRTCNLFWDGFESSGAAAWSSAAGVD